MKNYFVQNLKVLANKYTQKKIAEATRFSQSSVNNYLAGTSEPSLQFLINLKEEFNLNLEEFLFSDISDTNALDYQSNTSRFAGNYICYYYNNSAYKGSIHENTNVLNYGVLSVIPVGDKCKVYCTFSKSKKNAVKGLEQLNYSSSVDEILDFHSQTSNPYIGELKSTIENVFIQMTCKEKDDEVFIIFKNPPSKSSYVGGIATMNSIARGREHNPCIQYFLLSKKIINRPDGEIYNLLSMGNVDVDLTDVVIDAVELFKNLYINETQLSNSLSENQKVNLIENKLKYHFDNIIESNEFRYGKISNREDDEFYQLIKEEIDYDE